MAKRGRKARSFTHPETGETINGLSLRTKGRKRGKFFPTGKDAPCFGSADDWASALFKFQVWKAEQERGQEKLIVADLPEFRMPQDDDDDIIFEGGIRPIHLKAIAPMVKHIILTDPRQAAILFDCEPLARLADLDTLPEPTQDITLDDVGELYFNKKPPLSPGELRHSRRRWEQFKAIVKAKTARDLTQADIDRYYQAIFKEYESRNLNPSYVSKRFSATKTIWAWADRLNKAPEQTKRVLALLTTLIPPKQRKTLPTPISKRDLHQLLKVADVEEQAWILLGLNCAFYPTDIRNLTKTNGLDLERGIYAGYRAKTEIPQCSVLWPRTIEAVQAHLKANPNKTEFIFITKAGTPIASETFRKRFAALRKRAKVMICFNQSETVRRVG